MRLKILGFIQNVLQYLFSVSESQGQGNNPERTINKSASTPFIGASQPYNRLAWNPEMSGQTKLKQDEVN